MKLGKQAWANPQAITGFNETLRAAQNMTWQDCLKCSGLNEEECFKEELSTHVLYEMNKLRIMLIFLKGNQIEQPFTNTCQKVTICGNSV